MYTYKKVQFLSKRSFYSRLYLKDNIPSKMAYFERIITLTRSPVDCGQNYRCKHVLGSVILIKSII